MMLLLRDACEKGKVTSHDELALYDRADGALILTTECLVPGMQLTIAPVSAQLSNFRALL